MQRTSRLYTVTLLFAGLLSNPLTPTLNAQSPSNSPDQQARMPDERFYSLIFKHLLALQSHDAPLVASPSVGSSTVTPSIASFYTERVGAKPSETTTMLAAAQSWKVEVAPVDSQAHAIIAAIHAKTPGGRLQAGEKPPEVPAELVSLQHQRDAITLNHVAALKASFGEARFTILDASMRHNTHTTLTGPIPAQLQDKMRQSTQHQ